MLPQRVQTASFESVVVGDTFTGSFARVGAEESTAASFGLQLTGDPHLNPAEAAAQDRGFERRGAGKLWQPGRARGMLAQEPENNRAAALSEGQQLLSGKAAVVMLAINAVGPGIVGLPVLMSEGGWLLATVAGLIVTTTCMQCGALLCETCERVEEHEARGGSQLVVDCIDDVAQRLGGTAWRIFGELTRKGTDLGCLAAYMSITVDAISGICGDESTLQGTPKTKLRFIVVFPLFAALSLTNNIHTVRKLSEFGIVSTCVVVTSILLGSICRVPLSGHYVPASERSCFHLLLNETLFDASYTNICREYHAVRLQSAFPIGEKFGVFYVFLVLGRTIAYITGNMAIIGAIPVVRSQMQDRSIMPSVVYKAFGFASLAYLTVMVVGYRGFGDKISTNIINGFDDIPPYFTTTAVIGGGFLLINVLLGSPIFSLGVIKWAERRGAECCGENVWCEALSRPNIFLRFLLMLALATSTFFMPFFMENLVTVGCLCAIPSSVIMPVFLAHKAGQLVGRPAPVARTSLRFLVVAVAFLATVFGLIGVADRIRGNFDYEAETGVAWQ